MSILTHSIKLFLVEKFPQGPSIFKFLKTHRCLIIMNKNVVAALCTGLLLFQSMVHSQNSGFLSNEIQALSGLNDTLSILTAKYDQISNTVNYSLSHIPSIDSTFISNDLNWSSNNFEKNKYGRDLA